MPSSTVNVDGFIGSVSHVLDDVVQDIRATVNVREHPPFLVVVHDMHGLQRIIAEPAVSASPALVSERRRSSGDPMVEPCEPSRRISTELSSRPSWNDIGGFVL
jgi:hypothetical protein